MNSIVIKGRLTRDPELKSTQSNVPVCTVTVAVNRSYAKEENQADFFDCVFWRQGAEFVSKYFKKGQEILVSGEMQSRKYQDRDGNSRTAWELQGARAEFCGPKPEAEQASPAAVPLSPAGNFEELSADDDLPF